MCLAVRAQGAAGILAGALAVGEPGSWALTTFCLAFQEPQLLGAKSSVVSCLLEGPVQLGPGSVLQHCHLQVRPGASRRAALQGPGSCVCVCVCRYLGLC